MTADCFENEPHVKRLKADIRGMPPEIIETSLLEPRLRSRSRAIKDLSRLPAVWHDTVAGHKSPLGRTHHLLVEEIRVLDDEIVVLQNAIEEEHEPDGDGNGAAANAP